MNIITSTADLEAFTAKMREGDYITIDTEFLREKTYWPKLCLVQIANPEDAAIIDPLAKGIDLTPLFDLLQDSSVLKVFHAARQDIEIFVHLTGKVPTPIFDTQIAAMVCGFGESVGYETLVNALTKGKIDKSSRFTDWSHRPLSDKQLQYAISDVTHLRDIFYSLKDTIDTKDRSSWIEEEMAIMESKDTYITEPMQAWKKIKLRNHKPKVIAVLQMVAAWREKLAQKRDVPKNRLMRDETLLSIAMQQPRNSQALAKIRGFNTGMIDGKTDVALLQAVESGLHMPDDQIPEIAQRPNIPKGIGPIVDILKVLLRQKSDEHEVAPRLIANSADLEKIAAKDDPDVKALSGWRHELFGKAALHLKEGKIALTIDGRKLKFIELD